MPTMKRHYAAAGPLLLLIGGYLQNISSSSISAQHVLAVVGPANYDHVVRLAAPATASQRRQQQQQQLTWSAYALDSASSSSGAAFDRLCSRLTEANNVSAVLALTRDAPTTFVVVTVASLLGLPVLGYLSGYDGKNMFQVSLSFTRLIHLLMLQ